MEALRTGALVGHTCAFTHPLEEHLDAVLGKRGTHVGEKEMLFARGAPFGQFLLVQAMVF